MSNEKVTYEREGVRRQFSQFNIDRNSSEEVKYPENYGWKKVPQEVLDAEAKGAEIASGGEAPPAGEQNPEAKTSKDFKTSDAEIDAIKELLAGKTPEEITAFFEGETRVTLNNLKDSLLS